MALLSTVCVLVIMVCTFTVSDDNLATSATFKKCFKGKTIRTLYTLSFNECGSECKLRPKCEVVNYWKQGQRCELVDADGNATLVLAEVGDSCVSIARSDLPEVDGCRECTAGNNCASNNDSCERIECPSLTVGNGTVKGNMQNIEAKQKVICDENFRLESANASPVCEAAGNWSVVPQCMPIIHCPEPIMMDNATLDTGDTREGAMRTYTCHDNYTTATGSKNISVTCTNTGDWSPPTEICLRKCSEPSPVDKANLDNGDTLEGTVRNYTCFNNYTTTTGSMTISVTCLNTGEWTPLPEQCVRDCYEPGMMDNATLDTGHTHENTMRTYTCMDNYITAIGSSTVTVTCTRTGQWTTPTYTCLKSCGIPTGVIHGEIYLTRTHEGSVATLVCNNSYSVKVNGAISYDTKVGGMTCQSSGDWDSVECVLACANSVDLVTGDYGIADNLITATSCYGDSFKPIFGRLNRTSSWAAEINDIQQHIQFEFLQPKIVNEIVTQGFPRADYWWVTSYRLLYSADCDVFTEYNQDFQGNTDRNSHVSNEINPAIVAKCVRVNPQTWNIHIAMRVELHGCSA